MLSISPFLFVSVRAAECIAEERELGMNPGMQATSSQLHASQMSHSSGRPLISQLVCLCVCPVAQYQPYVSASLAYFEYLKICCLGFCMLKLNTG